MTSTQAKKGGAVPTEEDRKNILKQMKVRTKLKMDKSWIHQGSEDEKDSVTSPLSPQLKALEGRKLLWSPTPDSEPDRNSGIFTAKEIITSSSSPPVQSSNKNSGIFTAKEIITSSSSPPVQSSNNRFSYSSPETNRSPSTASPPPSTTGNKPTTSYIIRGQPVNAVSQVKGPVSYNGYQKSQVQARTASLPRVPTATGYKMSTEEYKKLAPYNVRNKSVDLSDDETPQYAPQEQVKRTEQASGVLRNKDRSYVISAAKRNSGVATQDSGSPFVAKRVEIQDEDISNNRKSQSLPKTLSAYLTEDANRFENNWKETQSKQTPPRVTERSSSPRLTSYSMTSSSSSVKPEAGKITMVREESHNESKDVLKPTPGKESNTTVNTTRTNRVTERSSSPRLTSYSISDTVDGRSSSVKPEAGKITVVREESYNQSKDVSKPPTGKDSNTTGQSTRTERVEVKGKKDETQLKSLVTHLYEDSSSFENKWKSDSNVQPTLQTSPARAKDKKDESLDSYLFEDASRFENTWKANQTAQQNFQTSPARIPDRPESPKLTSWSTEARNSTIKPEPGKITVLRDESDKMTPKRTENRTSTRTVTTTTGSGSIKDIPKLTSYSDITETKSSSIQAGPGKITVVREDSNKEPPKVTTQVSSTTRTTETKLESNKDSPDIPKLTSSSISRTLTENATPIMQTGPGKITVIREDSTPPKPIPRSETKPKDPSSDKQPDLISWTDLDNSQGSRLPKEKPASAPTPAARNTNKYSEKPAYEAPLIVISPESDNKRPAQPSRSETFSTETRYRVPEFLDDPEPTPSNNRITSISGDRNVKISIETLSEQPQTTDTFNTERSSSPRITSNSGNRNVRISVETLSEQPQTTESPRAERSSSPRPSPRSRESTTTFTETRYRVPEILEDTMLASSPSRSNSRTTVSTTRTSEPTYTEYLEDHDSISTRTFSSSMESITRTTTIETQYDNTYSGDTSPYDPQSGNKGVLFVKEYVNSTESLKSPTVEGSLPDFSGDSEKVSYRSNSNYMYSSSPRRSDEGPCTYCGREIKDCPKIMLDHLNIHCHEYCFKCGICHKPMGDLIANIFIHRDVVHCESCYEKLF